MEAHKEIDFGVFLEGEKTFSELVENMDIPEKVKGVSYRNDGQIHFTGKRRLIKEFPTIHWEKFPPDLYAGKLEGVGLLSKRGCVLKCL